MTPAIDLERESDVSAMSYNHQLYNSPHPTTERGNHATFDRGKFVQKITKSVYHHVIYGVSAEQPC